MDPFPQSCPICIAIIWSSGDDQAILFASTLNTPERLDQILKTLIWGDPAEEENRRFTLTNAEPLLGFAGREIAIANRVVDPKRNHGYSLCLHAKITDEFALHLVGVNENVVG